MEVAASVVGLMMAGAHISHMLGEFISSVKNVPALAQQLDDEVNNFRYILHKVQKTVIDSNALDPERAALIDINHLSSALTAAVCTFSELEQELDRVKASGRIDFWDRMKWSRAEKTLLNISVRLNRHETSLTLIFTILTSESLNWALSSKERLSRAFDAESLAASQADSIASSSTNESSSTMSMTTTASSITSIGGHEFDPALSRSRAYRRASDSDSVFSIDTLRTRIGRWSMYTAYSNDSVFSLPISLRETSGTTLADKAVGPVLLPINVDKVHQHERYRTDPQGPSKSETLREIRTPEYALGIAAEEGRHQEVHDLLRRGYSGSTRLPNGYQALDAAILNQHEHTVEVLIMYDYLGWDWGIAGRRRLNQAIELENLAIVSTLLEKVEFKIEDTACMAEIIRGCLELKDPPIKASIFKKLEDSLGVNTLPEDALLVSTVSAKLDMHSPGMRLILREAVRHGAVTVTKALLEGGADVNDDEHGKTLLHIAVQMHYGTTVQTPLSGAKKPTILEREDVVRTLVRHHADIEAKDRDGSTPLALAASAGMANMVQLLVSLGAKVNVSDDFGNTPLMRAAYKRLPSREIYQVLLNNGAKVNVANNKGLTPLHLAAWFGNLWLIDEICRRGANVLAGDLRGQTPARWAMDCDVARFITEWNGKLLVQATETPHSPNGTPPKTSGQSAQTQTQEHYIFYGDLYTTSDGYPI